MTGKFSYINSSVNTYVCLGSYIKTDESPGEQKPGQAEF
jgi:hypothetical protein